MHYLIYKITNNINGKFYIGQHQTDNLNDGYMGSGTAIRRAVNKYGIENFTKEILYDVDDWELMDFIEELIVDESFVKRKDTYNMKTGGQNGKALVSPFKGKHHSEDSKIRLSVSLKGRPSPLKGRHHTEEFRQKVSQAMKGKTSPNKGRHRTEEQKRKQSEKMKGRHPWNYGKGRLVLQSK